MKRPFAGYDKSPEKVARRSLLNELCSRHKSLLATNFPEPAGQYFIRKLHRDRPKLDITLIDKARYPNPLPGINMMRGDIFQEILTHPATLIDIDLFGGLPAFGVINLERAKNWQSLLITFTKQYRRHKLPGALQDGEDPSYFMEVLCKDNGWKPPIMPDIGINNPYRHPNKHALMGLVDNRGPQYWTFLVDR
jgi:hypothetical protein